jgi:hypothetical protein
MLMAVPDNGIFGAIAVRRMAGAPAAGYAQPRQRYPSIPEDDGFREGLNPSYELLHQLDDSKGSPSL